MSNNIFSGLLYPLWARHWSANSFDPRYWVIFGMSHWGINDVACVVDDFGDLVPVGAA